MEIRPFTEDSLPAIQELANSMAPARRRQDFSALKEMLTDSARAQGGNVRLLYESGELTGYLAWVKGTGGEFFGSPFVARTRDAARELLRVLLKVAQGQDWVRVSAFPEEVEKSRALREAGFFETFAFVEFQACPADDPLAALPENIVDVSVTRADPALFLRLHNEAFRGVDNSLPLDEAKAREILGSPQLHPGLSRLWSRPSGELIAFSLVNRDGYLDAIGVLPAEQGKGWGARLYSRILGEAAAEGFPRIYSTVSSRNEGSLRLHRRLGIAEVERRKVWQKDLRPSPSGDLTPR